MCVVYVTIFEHVFPMQFGFTFHMGPHEVHLDSTGVAVPSPSSEQRRCHAQAKGQIPMRPPGQPGPGPTDVNQSDGACLPLSG